MIKKALKMGTGDDGNNIISVHTTTELCSENDKFQVRYILPQSKNIKNPIITFAFYHSSLSTPVLAETES